MCGYPIPGSYPVEYQDRTSDSDTDSMDSMPVYGRRSPEPPSPQQSLQVDPVVEALGEQLEESLYVSTAEHNKSGEAQEITSNPAPDQPQSSGSGPPVHPPAWDKESTTPKPTLDAPTAQFTFGYSAPSDQPITSQKTFFGGNYPAFTPTSGSVAQGDRPQIVSRFDKYGQRKPVSVPPGLSAEVPDSDFSSYIPPFAQSESETEPDTNNDAKSSPSPQPVYMQSPEDTAAAEPSPSKHPFCHSEPSDTSRATTPVLGTFAEDAYQDEPVPQASSSSGITELHSASDFVERAQRVLHIEKDDFDMCSQLLSSLYDLFVTFTGEVVDNTKCNVLYEATILSCETSTEQLEKERLEMGLHADFTEINRRLCEIWQLKANATRGIANSDTCVQDLKNTFLNCLLGCIGSISDCYRDTHKASSPSAANLEVENLIISELRVDMLNLEDELGLVKEALNLSDKTVEMLQNQRAADKLRAANEIKTLQTSQRGRLDRMLSEHKTDKKEALSAQKEQYKAQIEDAEAKFRLYNEVTTQVEDLKKTVYRLEREKADVVLAKAALEKESQDLGLQAEQGKSFEDAYKQVKAEFDQLQADFNDAIAERDDLRESQLASTDALRAKNQVPGVRHVVLPTGVGVLKSYDADLALLEKFWKRQHHFAEMAKRETQTNIDEVDEDINIISRELAALKTPEAPGKPDSDSSESSDDDNVTHQTAAHKSHSSQLLDTFLSPLPTGDSTPASNAPAPESSRQVGALPTHGLEPRSTHQKLSLWADKTSGRTAPVDGHKKAAHSFKFSKVQYQGDHVSTAEED